MICLLFQVSLANLGFVYNLSDIDLLIVFLDFSYFLE